MTFGQKDPSAADAAILPFVGLGFSILVALIAPSYASWYRQPLPAYTTWYLAWYPVWIVLNLLAAVVNKFVKGMNLRGGEGGIWKKLDFGLSMLSVSSVLAGILLLLLPALSATGF